MKYVLLICLILAELLTGCVKKPEKTVITFMSWGSKSEVSIILPMIKEFEAQNPDIKIKFIHTPKNYFQKLHLLVASGLTPDVVFVNNIYGPLYAENNVFTDLKPFFTEGKSFHNKALQAFSHKGKLYAIPRDVSNMVVYYNKDIFDANKVPYPSSDWTIVDFLSACKKLANNKSCCVSFEDNPIFWLPYLWSNGGGFINKDLKYIDLSKPESLEAVQLYSDLRNKYHYAPTKSQAGSATMAQLFMQKKLAMQVSGRWFMPIYKQEIKFRWGVAKFPRLKAGSVVGCDSSGWAISSTSKHKSEAWRFIQFLSSKANIEKFTRSGLITPARNDVDDPEKIFTEVIKYSVPTPVTKNYQQMVDLLNNALEPVWEGKITAEKAINKELIKKLESTCVQ